MIAVAALLQQVHGLDAHTLDIWVAEGWVRPARRAGEAVFEEVDVARVRLIVELRDVVGVGDESVPVVLSLLDQLHATRRTLQHVIATLEANGDLSARAVVDRLRSAQ